MEWHEGDVIRKLRVGAGWTLEQLAQMSGVNIQVIHRLEYGRTKDPKLETLNRLAAPFGITGRDVRDHVPAHRPIVLHLAKMPPHIKKLRSPRRKSTPTKHSRSA